MKKLKNILSESFYNCDVITKALERAERKTAVYVRFFIDFRNTNKEGEAPNETTAIAVKIYCAKKFARKK